MPLPTPNGQESEDEFIGRCMASETMQSEFPDKDQRSAVCYRQWRGENKEESVRRHRRQVIEYSRAPVRNGVIEGVKIIGTESKNGYRYPANVLRKAKRLYESAAVFIYHPSDPERRRGSRQLVDHFGSLQNVRERGTGETDFGLFADLHIKQQHPMAQLVLESDGHRFGLSHNAIVEMNDDQSEVTAIVEVNSVDLVDNPATTTNLFEEDQGMEELKKTMDTLVEKIGVLETKLEAAQKEPPKSKRLTALEDKRETTEEVAVPIGNSHEDMLAVLRGFAIQ